MDWWIILWQIHTTRSIDRALHEKLDDILISYESFNVSSGDESSLRYAHGIETFGEILVAFDKVSHDANLFVHVVEIRENPTGNFCRDNVHIWVNTFEVFNERRNVFVIVFFTKTVHLDAKEVSPIVNKFIS